LDLVYVITETEIEEMNWFAFVIINDKYRIVY